MNIFDNFLLKTFLMFGLCLTQFASAEFTSVSLAPTTLASGTFEYQINLADANASGQDTITIKYTIPQTAWIAVGVNPPESGGGMVNGEVVIGKPTDNTVKKYKMTAKAAGSISELPNQTLINASLDQTGGNTVLTFTKLLVESGEHTITACESNTFIFGFGSSNTFGFHLGYGAQAVTLNVGACPAPPTPPPTTAAPVTTNPPTTGAPANTPTSPPGFEVLQLTGDLAGSTLSYQFTFDDPNTGGKDSMTVSYTAPVTAWVAVGASESGLMVGSDAVIGIPATGEVKKYDLNSKSSAGVVVMPDEKQTLVNAAVTQSNGMTTLTYTKILVEDGEVPINRVGENIFVAANGASNTLGIHAVRGSFSLSGKEVDGREKTLWIVHGCLAYLAWGVMCPVAILAGLLRMYIPGKGMWYEIHRTLQSLVIVFTVASVSVAIVALNKETPSNLSANHFSPDLEGGHRLIGLLVLIFALLQAVGGIMRPHLPAKNESSTDDEESRKGGSSSGGEKSTARKIWEVLHRVLGAVLLGLAWYQMDLGITAYHGIFDDGNIQPTGKVFYSVVGIMSFLLLMGIAFKVMMG